MKNKFIGGFAPLSVCALLLPMPARAQTTSVTATGIVDAVLAPPIVASNALGQVFLRGFVHTARVQSPDPRATGRELIIADGAYNADGSINLQGTSYLQVGTWDAAGTNFTPAAGTWVSNWRGLQQPNNSMQLTFAGYGSGASIDGWSMEGSITRGPDANAPLLDTATIKPPPTNKSVVVESFGKPVTGWTLNTSPNAQGSFSQSNGQLILSGQFSSATLSAMDWVYVGTKGNWTVPDGMTLEWRVDLVGLNDTGTNLVALIAGSDSSFYGCGKGPGSVYLYKLPGPSGGFSFLAAQPARVSNTNVVLALALTRVSSSIALTGRLLDKADPTAVMAQCSATDTPDVDATLSTDQFQELTGMNLYLDTDLGPPCTSFGSVGFIAAQYTDGNQPAVLATFDNLELHTSEIPPLGIERAVRVTCPATGPNYAVEVAPIVQGPFLR